MNLTFYCASNQNSFVIYIKKIIGKMQSGKNFNSFTKTFLTICKTILKWFLVFLPNHTYSMFLGSTCDPFLQVGRTFLKKLCNIR
jgi:hypothetical protein